MSTESKKTCTVIFDDAIAGMNIIPDKSVTMVYADPPFCTGKKQNGPNGSYVDDTPKEEWADYMFELFVKSNRILKHNGGFFLHIDYRMSATCKLIMDNVFGESQFRNEIIWAYDYGARQKRVWPRKHDTIYWYSRSDDYIFNQEEMDRIPYLAPGLCGKEKAEKGKTVTDVWWNTIVPTNGSERVGYPTQKPLKILERLIKVHSNPGDTVVDLFAGSGSFAIAGMNLGRKSVAIDSGSDSIICIEKRLVSLGYSCNLIRSENNEAQD